MTDLSGGNAKDSEVAAEKQEDSKTDEKENGVSETTAGGENDNALAEKIDVMMADKEGDELLDLDKDGLTEEVRYCFHSFSSR